MSLHAKLIALIAVAVAAMVALAAALISESRKRITDFHLDKATTALQVSLSILEQDQALVAVGELSKAEAQKRAIARLRKFRYDDGEGYVALVDDIGFMLMHPIHDHLDQTSIWDLQDKTGRYITRETIAIGQNEDIGVNRYHFENPVTGAADIKTSAVARFDAWGWTLIAGVFERGIDAAVSEMIHKAIVAVVAMSGLFLLLAFAIARSVSQPISELTTSMTTLADGDLDIEIPHQDARNECGAMARALAVFQENGRHVVKLQAEKDAAQRAIETERLAVTTRLREQFGKVINAASRGDFTLRVEDDLRDENLKAVASALNTLVETVDAGVSTVNEAMSSMSRGEQPKARADEFEGAFAELLAHVDETATTLQDQAQHLEHTALHDSLTGLPNRRYFEQKISQLFAKKDRSGNISLLHIDLDRFKEINDTLGHAAGDEILRHTARVLQTTGHETDFVARVGGDEFVVVCEQAASDDLASATASAIIDILKKPYNIDGDAARFGASIGIACSDAEDATPTDLLSRADVALYDAKKNGRGQFSVFTDVLKATHLENKRLREDIISGLENCEFFPYFQPQFDAQSRRIVGVEALARWKHPVHGVLGPHYFLNVAGEMGAVGVIDQQVFEAANSAIARINRSGVGRIDKLSVNVSLARLMDPRLLIEIDAINRDGYQLAFELLESIVFDEQGGEFTERLQALKDRDIEIEVDDFGTGHASITGLLRANPDRLKIDRQLIAPIVGSESQRRVIESIIEIGQTLNIGIVAEGVETMQHAELLTSMNSDTTLQGYAFAPPLSEEDLMELFEEQAYRQAS